MTTFNDRPNSALLVIDVQNGVVTGSHDRDGVVGRIATLVDKARAEDVPVVWVQHNDDALESGSQAWQIVSELSPSAAEPVVQKRYGDSFEGTELETV
ncbi:MAG: isochorismatase family protein, partial [Ornithinibacter sp.]